MIAPRNRFVNETADHNAIDNRLLPKATQLLLNLGTKPISMPFKTIYM